MIVDILQVGAHTGISWNNHCILSILKESHSAIFLEPVSFLFENLVFNYNKRYPNNKFNFINKACSNKTGKLKMYVPNVPVYTKESEQQYIDKKIPAWTDQLSSTLREHVAGHNLNLEVNEIEVECTTLNDLIKQYDISEINFLNIDTEGHDFEVIEGLNLEMIKPKEIRFEHKHMEGSNKVPGKRYHQLMTRLQMNGYKLKDKNTEDTLVVLSGNQ